MDMSIGAIGGFGWPDFGRALWVRAPAAPPPPAPGGDASPLRELARQVLDLRAAAGKLRRAIRLGAGRAGRPGGGVAGAQSAGALGLSLQVAFTTLRSTEQVNTVPTSISTRAPALTGGSTAAVSIGGTYNGSLGSQTLTFRAKKRGTVGVDAVVFQVKDGSGRVLGDVQVPASGGPVALLGTGLSLMLSPGTVDKHGEFKLGVFANIGTAVQPDNPFNGTGSADPEFDPGLRVTAGAFTVNGVAIDVRADDTLNGVLAKIDASRAGVAATFDAATETVLLTARLPGAEHIVLGNDTSGFLAATKLRSAVEAPGHDTDLRRPIAEVASLAALRSGTFAINGVELSVDRSADSLQDVFDRIDASGAGARIAFDAATGEVVVTATDPARPLLLDDGTSGFFSALGIAPGRHDPPGGQRARKPALQQERLLEQRLREFGERLQSLYATDFGGAAAGAAAAARTRVREGSRSAFAAFTAGRAGERLRSGLGLELAFDDPGHGVLRLDRTVFGEAARNAGDRLARLLVGQDRGRPDGGLLDAIDAALDQITRDLEGRLDPLQDRGLRLDLLV